MAGLLDARGVRTVEEAKAFFDAGLHRLHDPFSLLGVEEAVHRIARAVEAGELVGVYGDYDVDGQTSTALLVRVIRDLRGSVKSYIPHRIDEGYGLNIEALRYLQDQGCSLVVTVDCGITAVDEAEWARTHGLDLIITDHHQPPERLPSACAIINPKLDGAYPCPHLAGCGVAFKLAEALGERIGPGRSLAHRYVELAALGTVADVVPLLDENRSLVRAGLTQLNTDGQIPGLQALRSVAGIEGAVKPGHIGFVLGPRLNAAGRTGDPSVGLHLLVADTYEEALPLARALEAENTTRRRVEGRVVTEALAVVSETYDLDGAHGLVVDGRGWHSGVIGIVASRLVDAYHRPTIVLSVEGDAARGSGRSIPGFDLFEALDACADLFDRFGGHKAAAGLTMQTAKIEAFRERFLEVTGERLSADDLIPRLDYDGYVNVDEMDVEWIDQLRQLEPFGLGNPTPVLVCRDVRAEGKAAGRTGAHLKLSLSSPGGSRTVDGIGFDMAGSLLDHLVDPGFVDVAFVPEVNEWQGRRSPSLRLKDIRPSAAAASPAARVLNALEEAAAAGEEPNGTVRGVTGDPDPTPDMQAGLNATPYISVLTPFLRIEKDRFDAVDRRGASRIESLREVLASGRSVYLIPGPRERGVVVARTIAEAGPFFRERNFLWRDPMPGSLAPLVKQAMAAPPWVLVASYPPASGARQDDGSAFLGGEISAAAAPDGLAALVWDPPYEPYSLLAHLTRLAALTGERRLILAFDRQGVDDLHSELPYVYPDRDRLGRVYIALQEAADGANEVKGDITHVTWKVNQRRPTTATERTVTAALAIFKELGLIEEWEGGWRVLLKPGSKVDLTQSVLYNEGTEVREGFLTFAEGLLAVAPEDFVEWVIDCARKRGA